MNDGNLRDASDLLREHSAKANWLKEADALLADSGEREFWSNSPLEFSRFNFVVKVPHEIWASQLKARADEVREEVSKLDKAMRDYLDALKP